MVEPDSAAAEIDLPEAARRLDVHYMTAYRYVRTGRLPARRHAGRWWVDPGDLQRVTPGAADSRPTAGPVSGRAADRLHARLLAGDEHGAWDVLEQAVVAAGGRDAAVTSLLVPAMQLVGDRWAAGEISVGDEHRATTIATRLVGRLSPWFTRPGRQLGAVVLACVPGEHHALPLAMVSLLLRGHGYDAVELGADSPVDVIADAVSASAPLAVGLSVSSPRRFAVAREAVAAVRATGWDGTVLVGGYAVRTAAHARRLGADGWAPDAEGALDVLRGLAPRHR